MLGQSGSTNASGIQKKLKYSGRIEPYLTFKCSCCPSSYNSFSDITKPDLNQILSDRLKLAYELNDALHSLIATIHRYQYLYCRQIVSEPVSLS